MYADDTNLFFNNVSYTKLCKKANEELHQVDSQLTANKLTSNIEKTKVITFKTHNSHPVPPNVEIKLNGNALDKVTSIRFLGVTIHEHLMWKSHTKLLLKKIRMGTYKKQNSILTKNHFNCSIIA